MNPYETILHIMREQGMKDNPEKIQIGIMENAETCRIGKLVLTKGDLLIAEHLKTGYYYNIDRDNPETKNDSTFIKPLKAGDKVAVYRMSDTLYIILERLV